MAGADSSDKHLQAPERTADASFGSHSATEAFHDELMADARKGGAKKGGGGGAAGAPHEQPHKKQTPEQVAAARASRAREEYKSILDDAATHAYDPNTFSGLPTLEHLYDNKIKNNRDAVAYAAQALKFVGDPYTALMLDEKSFPVQDAQVGINLAYPTDHDTTHGADNKPVPNGALQAIDSVDPNSAAAKAGLQKGDQITYIDGQPMRGRAPDEIGNILYGVNGTKVDVTVMRNGQQRTVEMTRVAPPGVQVDAPDGKTGKLGFVYGMLDQDHKHLATRTDKLSVNQNQSKHPETNDIIIQSVLPNSAAEKAGLLRGDVIRGVNGHSIAGESFKDVANDLRGNVGEPLDLHILRKGAEQDVHAVRGEASIVQNVVAKDLGKGIEYIKVGAFEDATADDIKKAMESNPNAKGFILDLRGNPGGMVDAAVKTAELLMKDGPLYTMRERFTSDPAAPEFGTEKVSVTAQSHITERGRDGENPSVYNDPREEPYLLNGRPLLILTDGMSASASEILTGAMKDNHIATVLGEKTFGKGIGQLQAPGIDSTNQYKWKVTNFRYFTPSGFWPGDAHKNRIGIDADIKVADDLSAGDPQLDAGISWMEKKLK
jgi:carboxyl-terminal processing protease